MWFFSTHHLLAWWIEFGQSTSQFSSPQIHNLTFESASAQQRRKLENVVLYSWPNSFWIWCRPKSSKSSSKIQTFAQSFSSRNGKSSQMWERLVPTQWHSIVHSWKNKNSKRESCHCTCVGWHTRWWQNLLPFCNLPWIGQADLSEMHHSRKGMCFAI